MAERRGQMLCRYCGIAVRRVHWSAHDSGADTATVDHVRARANGGGNEHSNLVIACRACNMRKGAS
jgi:5-methylcytosine-specific restriction endonuclease McrA